jgi:dTDP-4-dehydrorhamnose 3,5-epimerase-like enzyme
MTKIIKTKLSHIIEIPKIQDEGFLCFAESTKDVPFDIRRFYYIFGVNDGAIRGKHAHKKTQQILFCLKGSIKIILDNGNEKEEIILANPNQGIFLDKMMWHDMLDFKKDTILLIIASDFYAESDYIRNYEEFLSLMKNV